MTAAAIPALETQVRYARELFAGLDAAEWQAASGCAGWRVQDVAQHMAAVFQQIADPASIDTGDSGKTEQAAEVPVRYRSGWSVGEVIDAYDEWSTKGIAALAALQEPPMSDAVVPLSDLGAHPLHLLGNAIVFDHYCHLRHDIGAAVERAAQLPQDADALAVTLDWMFAGLPQMCADGLSAVPQRALNLMFDGPGGGAFVLAPGDGAWTVISGSDPQAPTVQSTVHDFISWGTKRADWRTTVTGDTDQSGVAALLDVINII